MAEGLCVLRAHACACVRNIWDSPECPEGDGLPMSLSSATLSFLPAQPGLSLQAASIIFTLRLQDPFQVALHLLCFRAEMLDALATV